MTSPATAQFNDVSTPPAYPIDTTSLGTSPNNAAINQPDPLAPLIDIQLPADVSWWPMAFGWWLLILLVIGVCLSIALYYRRNKKNAYRLEALSLLTKQGHHDIHRINQLLKRTAITAYGQSVVASLHGHDWLNFLTKQAPQVNLSMPTKALLAEGLYKNLNDLPESTAQDFYRFTQQWIAQHKQPQQGVSQKTLNTGTEASC